MKGEKELELHMKTKIRRMEIPMSQSYQIFRKKTNGRSRISICNRLAAHSQIEIDTRLSDIYYTVGVLLTGCVCVYVRVYLRV